MSPIIFKGKTPAQLIDAARWRGQYLWRRRSLARLRTRNLKREQDWLDRVGKIQFVYNHEEAERLLARHGDKHPRILTEAEDAVAGYTSVPGFGRRAIDLSQSEFKDHAERYAHRLLCRLDFLRPLVRASFIEPDNGEYLAAIENYLAEWSEVRLKPDRFDSVDEAIRALILLETLALVGEKLPPLVFKNALKSIVAAGWTIQANRARTGNHLIYEGLALFYIGHCLWDYYQSTIWRERGRSILETSMRQQVFSDGLNAEMSTGYHLITGTNFLKAWAFGRKLKRNFPGWFNLRLAQMVMVGYRLHCQDGGFFAIGDSDRMIGPSREEREAQAFARLGRMIAHPAEDAPSDLDLDFLLAGLDSGSNAEVEHHPEGTIFSAGGYQILRDKNRNTLLFDTGPFGLAGASHHGHADSLAIEVHLLDTRFLVDPGGFSYVDRPARLFARSTAAHNTVRIDGRDSTEVSGDFGFGRGAQAKLIDQSEIKGGYVMSAVHDGYQRLSRPVLHQRGIVWLTDQPFFLLIVDRIEGKGRHLAEVFFHGDGEWLIDSMQTNRLKWTREQYEIAHFISAESDTSTEVQSGRLEPDWQGWVAPVFGEYLEAPTVIVSSNVDCPAEIVNLFFLADCWPPLISLNGEKNTVYIGSDVKLSWKWEGQQLVVQYK